MEHLKDYVGVNGQEYYISTKNTFDVGLETMVFKSENNYVIDWGEMFYKHYKTVDEAIKGHNYIINNLEKCLEEGKIQNWQNETGINPFAWESIEKVFKLINEKGR